MSSAVRILVAILAFLGVAYLPGVLASGSTGAATDLRLGALLAEGSVLAFAVAFAGGVATSLTPCVYPLIPITVSIFGARKAGRRRDAIVIRRWSICRMRWVGALRTCWSTENNSEVDTEVTAP
jgi:thiol:disulfide interchange protein DsbD